MIQSERDLLEKELLSAVYYGDCMKDASKAVRADDFIHPGNRTLWMAMCAVWERDTCVTDSLVLDAARELDPHGVENFTEVLTVHIHALEASNVWPVLLKHLRERSKREELRALATDISRKVDVSAGEIVRFQKLLADSQKPENLKDTRGHVQEFADMLCNKFSGSLHGVSTGFPGLDALIGGLSPQNLYIVAARPKAGKTALKAQIARSITGAGGSALLVCCEMAAKMELLRMAAADTGIPATRVQTGQFSESELKRLLDSVGGIFHGGRLELIEMVGASPDEVCAGISAQFERKHFDVVFVDQLQAMRFQGRNLVQEMGRATKALRTVANKHNCAVVLLCQLNRNTDKNDGGVPQLSNLRDSGDIEQDADLVLFIHHERTQPKATQHRNAWFIVAASRYGSPGRVPMSFHGPSTTFTERPTTIQGADEL